MNYSEMVRKYIEDSGMTLQQVADGLVPFNYNVSKGYISQLQNGKTDRPATDEFNRAFATVTGGDVEKLLTAALIEKAPPEIKEKFEKLNKLKELKVEYEKAVSLKEAFEVREASEEGYEPNIKKIPLLGSIAAGQPLDRIEFVEDVEFVDRTSIRGKEAFALRVKGDSMIGDFITNGDIVICVRQEEVLPTDIAVVAVDAETATLKRVKHHGSVCMLIPSNNTIEPTIVDAKKVSILGKVIEVRRRF